MSTVPFIFDSQDPGNAQSLRDLHDFKTADGLVVTDANQDPQDPNRLVISLSPPMRAFGVPQPVRALTSAANVAPVKILCVHGVNHLEPDEGAPPTASEQDWRNAITQALAQWGGRAEVRFVPYNQYFADADLSPLELARAVARLTSSGVWHGITDIFGARGFGPQGGLADSIEWTAGMVCEWAGNDRLRTDLRSCLLKEVAEYRPQLILAHSLGSLIAYDTLARPANAGKPGVAGVTLATFGSQIGHPFVRQVLGGRIVPIPALRHWFHLFNPEDHVFTAPLDIRFRQGEAPNFSQHTTEFDLPWDPLNHDASQYLLNPGALGSLWRDAATQAGTLPANLPGLPRLMSLGSDKPRPSKRAAQLPPADLRRLVEPRRALLVGIGNYPNPANNLAGCVNDVFLMSRLLQEAGFKAENIRVVLNDRATAGAILERLGWLLEGAGDGQDRVFYYAGHGAQIPGYGPEEKVDSLDECLVPYDFNWSRETAVMDDQFYELYSQLPENTKFLTILDCCHSGGMTREGGLLARGLTPPDDIRHRILEWESGQGVFGERRLRGQTVVRKKPDGAQADPRHGPLHKLGRGVGLRPDSKKSYDKARAEFGHTGPFMPHILQACSEGELACEYRHGSESNGAFTYFLAKALHDRRRHGGLTWESLTRDVARRLMEQGYTQTPQLACPTALRSDPVPWQPKGR